jgi:hypothetical protein
MHIWFFTMEMIYGLTSMWFFLVSNHTAFKMFSTKLKGSGEEQKYNREWQSIVLNKTSLLNVGVSKNLHSRFPRDVPNPDIYPYWHALHRHHLGLCTVAQFLEHSNIFWKLISPTFLQKVLEPGKQVPRNFPDLNFCRKFHRIFKTINWKLNNFTVKLDLSCINFSCTSYLSEGLNI